MRRSTFILALCLLGSALPGVSAAGQGPSPSSEPARFTVGAGAGTGESALHDDASGMVWETTARIRTARYFGLELGVGQLSTRVETPAFSQTTRSSTTWSAVTALAMATAGRVTISGGGGVGTAFFDRTFTQGAFENHYSNIGFRFHGVVGADVDLGARLQAFALARFGVNGGYVDKSIAGGLRVILRR